MSLLNHLEKIRDVPMGKVRLDDFFIIPYAEIVFRNPYEFVYQEITEDHPFVKVRKTKQFNPLGYCPHLIQWTLEFLLHAAKEYSYGSKWHRQMAKRTERPRDKHCYPIARMVHFEIDLDNIGLFGYTIVRKKKYRIFYAKRRKKE